MLSKNTPTDCFFGNFAHWAMRVNVILCGCQPLNAGEFTYLLKTGKRRFWTLCVRKRRFFCILHCKRVDTRFTSMIITHAQYCNKLLSHRLFIFNFSFLFLLYSCGYTAYCCRKMISAVNFATTRIHRPPHCIRILSLNNAITQSHHDGPEYDSADVRSVYYRITVRLCEPPRTSLRSYT